VALRRHSVNGSGLCLRACLEPEFELTVPVELARPGGMAKRPYVAIWIEDADPRPARTIALP
jgi:hypothetical protein